MEDDGAEHARAMVIATRRETARSIFFFSWREVLVAAKDKCPFRSARRCMERESRR
jgi:hypothetical protein